jgi:hypothetical protein
MIRTRPKKTSFLLGQIMLLKAYRTVASEGFFDFLDFIFERQSVRPTKGRSYGSFEISARKEDTRGNLLELREGVAKTPEYGRRR